jgi:hypothetical protein
MISDVGEEPASPREVRDDTGLVVGSPAWLELQRATERSRTGGISREGMRWIAAGVVVIAISLVTTLAIATSDDQLGPQPTAYEWVLIGVLPLLVGVVIIQRGRRMRASASRSTPSVPPPAGPMPPTSTAPPSQQP